MALTMDDMTAKEHLHKLVDELTDAEARNARIVLHDEEGSTQRAQKSDDAIARSYTDTPQLAPDGWADLSKVNQTSREAVLKRLDDEERAAGFQPW